MVKKEHEPGQNPDRVLQIGLSYNPGGVESFVMNYYRRLVKRGMQFDFICMYGRLAYQDEIKKMGGKIYNLPDVKKRPGEFKKELKKVIREGGYQIVYVNMLSAANIVPLRAAYEEQVPRIIAHSHNAGAPGRIRNFLHKINMRAVKKYATDYHACGKEAARWLFGETDAGKAVIIQNAIEVDKFLFRESARQKMRKLLEIGEDTFVLGHVGRLEEQKNHDFLLDIFRETVREREDSRLICIGEGILKEKLQNKARQLGIEKKVMFLGTRQDVPDLLCAMDVFVFPSFYEGLSVTAVEAQCAGLPCVVSAEISEETAIMESFRQISLKETAKAWAHEVLAIRKNLHNIRDNGRISNKMEKAGFDIRIESDKLYKILRG